MKIMKLSNVPEALNVSELMEVKGGIGDKSHICVFAAAVKCTVAGSGVIIQPEQM